MLPTVLLLGFAIGRWWAVPLLAIGWAVVVPDAGLVGAAGLAAGNAFVAVALRVALTRTWARRSPAITAA
jgi:hypothetical protein